MKIMAIVLWALIASQSAIANAEALRCDGDLAQVGDSKASVFKKCGTPFFADSFCKPFTRLVEPEIPSVVPPPCVLVDEWSYNPGPGQFITILRFETGVVTGIRFGDRVR